MPDAADGNQPDPEHHSDESEQPDHRPRHYRRAPPSAASSPFLPRDPLRRRWHNAALRIGSSERVHAVRFALGDDGRERVAPACHTGHDRSDHSDELHPVRDQSVTCHNCLHYAVALADGQPYIPARNQLLLNLPGIPAPASWPPPHPDQQPPTEP